MHLTNIINCTNVFLTFMKPYEDMRLMFTDFLDSLKETKSAFYEAVAIVDLIVNDV